MYGYVHEGHDSTLAPGSSVPLAAGRDQGLFREGGPRECPSVVTTGQIQLGVTMRRVFSLAMAVAIVLSFAFVGSRPGSALAAGSAKDVYVGSYDGDALVPGACVQLVPYSNVGCDQNGDGYVWFQAIPVGTYTIKYVSVPYGYELPAPEWLPIYRNSETTVTLGIPLARSGVTAADVSIVSYDSETGELLTGACFSLRGYSNVGCDENGDGQVDFADIPYGTYVIDIERFPVGTTLAYPGGSNDILGVSASSGSHTLKSILFTTA